MNINFQSKMEQIVDELAEKSFSIIGDFLTPEEVHVILHTDEFKNSKLHFKKAGIGRHSEKQIVESIRGDYIQWIDPRTAPDAIRIYIDRLTVLMQFLNQSLFLSLKGAEVHLTRYPIGTFYKKHIDQFRQDDHRKLSAICYLNTGWKETEGGQLRMHLKDGPLDVFPEAGKLVCFRSELVEHEVLPATRERYSLTGWLIDKIL
ncbi:MAG TPA: 2OG-Fe(II) oxygenase [Cyclobacteriaceae bacterium]|nr:2OG-Fe(II) oxygenase [Cyclobacteriaceae bacterium]